MNDNFKCPDCGAESPLEQIEFAKAKEEAEIKEDASMTCPVCKSKFSITAMLTSPGQAPGAGEEIAPSEELPSPEEEMGGEEAPPAPAGGAGTAPEAGGMGAGGGGENLQITPAESVTQRVEKAFEAAKAGMPAEEILGLLRPMKIASPGKMKVSEEARSTSDKIKFDQLAAQVNLWVGEETRFTDEHIRNLAWAFAMDEGTKEEFDMIVQEMKDEWEEDHKELDYAEAKKNPEALERLREAAVGGMGTHGRSEKFRAIANALKMVKDVQGDTVEPSQLANLAWAFSIVPEVHDEFNDVVADLTHADSGMGKGEEGESVEEPSGEVAEARQSFDLTPSPSEYRHLLRMVIQYSPNKSDRNWAMGELRRVKNVSNWHQGADAGPKDLLHFEPPRPTEGKSAADRARKWLGEKMEVPKDWSGEFSIFNAKMFGICKDLNIGVDQIEEVLTKLDEDGAISLNANKIKLDLKKVHKSLVDYLEGQSEPEMPPEPEPSPEPAPPAGPDLTQPPPEPSDLGSAPPEGGQAPVESVNEEKEKKDIEDEVEKLLAKYFA
jgi:DNA-directed RNA polymerase subunit RPC12/RpoP